MKRLIPYALIALGLALLSSVGLAAPRIGTYTWNYKNRPVVAPVDGYEYVGLSARGILAPGVADSLRSLGASALVWLQPTIAISNGNPLVGPDYPWDTAVVELVARHNAILRTADGRPADLFPPSGQGYDAWLLDYRDTAFVDEFASLIVDRLISGKAAGVLWDYGCGDISWNAAIGIDGVAWTAWRRGFVRLVARTRALRGGGLSIVQCDQYPADLAPVTDGAFYEQCGMSLNPLAKVWANVNRLPGRTTIVRVEELLPSKRRPFAALSLLTDCRFNWSDLRGDYGGGTQQSYRDVEHFTLAIGVSGGERFERSPGVWERMFTRGLVILNLSSAPVVYPYSKSRTYTIAPGDGFVLQNRDARGRFISPVTNAGR